MAAKRKETSFRNRFYNIKTHTNNHLLYFGLCHFLFCWRHTTVYIFSVLMKKLLTHTSLFLIPIVVVWMLAEVFYRSVPNNYTYNMSRFPITWMILKCLCWAIRIRFMELIQNGCL